MGNGEFGLGWVCGCRGSGDVETLYVNIVSSSVETVVSTATKVLCEGCKDYGCKGRTAYRTVTVQATE
jgi:hypothetical protein